MRDLEDGQYYEGVAKSQIKATTLCFIQDFDISFLTLKEFPFEIDSDLYHTDLYLTRQTYDEVFGNKELFQFIQFIDLEFEGLQDESCSFS